MAWRIGFGCSWFLVSCCAQGLQGWQLHCWFFSAKDAAVTSVIDDGRRGELLCRQIPTMKQGVWMLLLLPLMQACSDKDENPVTGSLEVDVHYSVDVQPFLFDTVLYVNAAGNP